MASNLTVATLVITLIATTFWFVPHQRLLKIILKAGLRYNELSLFGEL